ncbi:MAG: acyl carrier protein [Candidatus Methanofastidiosa archaeon]|nr:acyl carrier protein [Candidatus Methanofastidiosa archaeon]
MEQICELINENLELEVDAVDIGEDDSLGMDSISSIRLVVAIEAKFNVEFDVEYLLVERLDTKNKLKELLESKIHNDTK